MLLCRGGNQTINGRKNSPLQLRLSSGFAPSQGDFVRHRKNTVPEITRQDFLQPCLKLLFALAVWKKR
jgi:hypothetical protein